jgi:amino acid adenylation domain-containing protein/thioester reductase-like protein
MTLIGLAHDQRCIHQLFEAQAAETPNAIAVVFENEHLTYHELNQRSNCLAHYLRRLQVEPETLVGVYLERSLDLIVGLLAILKAGGVYVPLDPSHPPERLAMVLEDSQVPILLTHYALSLSLPNFPSTIVCLDTSRESIAQEVCSNPIPLAAAANLAYIIYTSGSTGKPKGVMIEHCSLVNFIQAARLVYGTLASDRILQFASTSFDAAIEEIFLALTGGATLLLRPADMLSSIPAFLHICEQLQVTVLDLTTAFWHRICAELPQIHLPASIRLILIGGERVVPHYLEIWKQFVSADVRLVNSYGPTEATIVATACDLAGSHAVEVGQDLIPIGKPLANVQVHVLDAEMHPIPCDTSGELYISGLGLARGYLHRSELTNDRFIVYPVDGCNPVRLYKTGDLVRLRQDGLLEFCGRVDNQEKIRGFRVELNEIERVLEQHPVIQESVVITKENTLGDKRLIAYVVQSQQEWNRDQTGDRPRLEADHVEQWRHIHDDHTLNLVKTHWDSTFNISGWISSYTKALIPDQEMQEWVDQTVARILDLHPQRVLEIGCGTGLLLFRIAPHCLSYMGTDISETALTYVEQQLHHTAQVPPITLERRAADNFQDMDAQSFDMVIINSVLQYFPSVDYLIDVIKRSLQVLKPDGYLFLGDVRNHLLLEAFIAATELHQAAADLPVAELRSQIQKRLYQESELTLDPNFFAALPQWLPQIRQVQVLLKRGQFANELNQFRYDVILQVGAPVSTAPEVTWVEWQDHLSIPQIRQLLQQHPDSNPLGIYGIPNSRVLTATKTVELLNWCSDSQTVADLYSHLQSPKLLNGINPTDLWQLAQDCGYDLTISWLGTGKDGAYQVLFQSPSLPQAQQAINVELPVACGERSLKPLQAYANDPLQSKDTDQLADQLRSYLKKRLPEYMIPAAFMVLDQFPLTPNGKVDRSTLPHPGSSRPSLSIPFLAPQTLLEKELAEFWSKLLEVDEVGVNDDFFALGGDSLRLMQLMSHIAAQYQLRASTADFFKLPTIAALVQQIQRDNQEPVTSSDWMTLQQLQTESSLDITIAAEAPRSSFCTNPQSILLTGATGFIGCFLLNELLNQTNATVYCLIHANTLKEAYEKIKLSFKRYLPGVELPYARIVLIPGDLTRFLMGLTKEKFDHLAETIEVIYHSAANTNLFYPYKTLKAANVIGTKTVLSFASHKKLKTIHYISTLDVFESLLSTNRSVVYEQDNIAQGDGMRGGYAQSKWIAEQLVTQAAQKGIPTCIYRPGMVTGHSHSGVSNSNDLIGRLLSSFIQLRSAPDVDWMIDMTPVDYISQAIAHLSLQPESLDKAFHLANPHSLPIATLVNDLNRFGYPVNPIPYEQWQTLIHKHSNALTPLTSAIDNGGGRRSFSQLEFWLAGTQQFDHQNTLNGLKGTAITCPVINTSILDKYLSYLITQSSIFSSQLCPNY